MHLSTARSLFALLLLPLALVGCPSTAPNPTTTEPEGTAEAAPAAPPEAEEVDPTPAPEAGADAHADAPQAPAAPEAAEGSGAAAAPGLQLQRPTMQLRPSIQNVPAGGLQIRPNATTRIRPANPTAVQQPRLQLAPQ